MNIVHLADLHFGYRAYPRTTPEGVNQREADVSAAAGCALEKAAELRPDLVVIAGDLFHAVRPSNAAIADAFHKLAFLVASLPGVPVVLVAGDRETPRSTDSATILELFREIPGIFIATRRVERFHFEDLDAEVIAVPHAALASSTSLELRPRGGARHSVLVLHTAVIGNLPGGSLPGPLAEGGAVTSLASLAPQRWSYVALGHHPVVAQVAPNAWYSGSLERTSAEPWAEADVEKGLLQFETTSASATFHAIPTRRVLDLPRISARGRTQEAVTAAIRSVVSALPEGVHGAIARLTITDIPPTELREVDQELLRQLRVAALHFVLDARPPRRLEASAGSLPVRGVSLETQVEEYLGRIWQPSMPGIERERLVELARGYLTQAAEGAER